MTALGRSLLLGFSIAGAQGALAQSAGEAAAQPAVNEGVLEAIEVSATRVARDGYEAPTPTTVMGSADIEKMGRTNIADMVNSLPALSGSVTPRSSASAISSGLAGVNNLNLRSLGTARTLVLLDGVRVVGATFTGAVDINQFPDALIQRVDIVTGGASAAWGSDAVSGVVNFVLDRKFTGLKGSVTSGQTSAGDNQEYKASLTGGTPFAGGRGHFLISGDYSESDGIAGVPRSWYEGHQIINNPGYSATNGQPGLIVRPNVGIGLATPGGLVVSGPLRGTYFGAGGSVGQFDFGQVSSPMMQGGDWAVSDMGDVGDLHSKLLRRNLYTRASFELTDSVEVFAEASVGFSRASGTCCVQFNLGNITVQRENPFIPASVAAQMDTLGLPTLQMGSLNGDLGGIVAYNERRVNRFVIGAEGSLPGGWTWDAYAQRGVAKVDSSTYLSITSRYSRAVDAVRSPSGAIVCRSTLTNPTDGCVPYNVFGTGVNSDALRGYLLGTPWVKSELVQEVVAASIQGEPFSTWAGPVSLATGAEHRKESVDGTNDTLSDTNSYFAGNYHASHGSFEVAEGFFEAVVPLAAGQSWARELDLNGAVRYTSYDTSGSVVTWKAGITWTPMDDLRFRTTRSRDIRAPNLNDLYQAGQVNTQTISDPFRGGATTSILRPTVGNVALKPEIADSLGLGVVYRPSFIPGFTASIDYYDIEIGDAIATINQQQVIDRCFGGNAALCSQIVRNSAGAVTQVTVQPVNLLTQTTRGFDIEASYQLPLSDLVDGWRGNLTVRALGTRIITLETDDGITKDEAVGEYNVASLAAAKWRYLGMVTYDRDTWNVTLTARGVSSGVYDTAYIECTTGCPASTVAHPTIDNNKIKGALYQDLAFAYKLANFSNVKGEIFVNVENITDKDPEVVAGGSILQFIYNGSNPQVHDTLGRIYRAGVRFQW